MHMENKNVVLNEIQHFVIQKDSYLCKSQNVPFEMRKVFEEFLECFVQEIDWCVCHFQSNFLTAIDMFIFDFLFHM